MKLKDIFITKREEERLYKTPCPVIGLTGGIATGKSTVSNLFIKSGIPVICADKLVKSIYQKQETFDFIKDNFPKTIVSDAINFKSLREQAFLNAHNKDLLESFIYKRLPQAYEDEFSKLSSPQLLIYDVPLLFEKKMQSLFDLTICVYAKREIQIKRIIERDNSSVELAEKILSNQIAIDDKKELSDFCINNNKGLDKLELEFQALSSLLLE